MTRTPHVPRSPKIGVLWVAMTSLAVALALMGCGRQQTVRIVGPFAIVPFRERTAAECERQGAGDQLAPPVYPTIVKVEDLERASPDLLLPQYLSPGLVFKELRVLDQGSVLLYGSTDESGGLSLMVTIDQGRIPPPEIRIEVPDGLYEPVTVKGRPGLVVRGIYTITTESVRGERRVTKCEWRTEAQTKLLVAMDDRRVAITAGPPGSLTADELIRIAESLEPRE